MTDPYLVIQRGPNGGFHMTGQVDGKDVSIDMSALDAEGQAWALTVDGRDDDGNPVPWFCVYAPSFSAWMESAQKERAEWRERALRAEALAGWENAELRPSVQAATDLLESKGYVVVHGNDQAALEADLTRLREALQGIKDNCGGVCENFELCEHRACQQSYEAWARADYALTQENPDD